MLPKPAGVCALSYNGSAWCEQRKSVGSGNAAISGALLNKIDYSSYMTNTAHQHSRREHPRSTRGTRKNRSRQQPVFPVELQQSYTNAIAIPRRLPLTIPPRRNALANDRPLMPPLQSQHVSVVSIASSFMILTHIDYTLRTSRNGDGGRARVMDSDTHLF